MYPENLIRFDLHSHILPKMDDGSSGSAESVEMLRELWKQGVRAVVATPHFYPWNDEPEEFFERRAASSERLCEVLREHEGEEFPTVYIGAEVAFYRGLASYAELSKLCIIGTDHILIEMPFEKWSRTMVDEVISIKKTRSITPVIAHIERYFSCIDESMLDALVENGCVIQGNADPLLRFFARRRILDLIKRERIHVLGSDAHNMTSRAPHIDRATAVLKEKLGEKTVDALNVNAAKVMSSALDLYELVDKELL